MRAVFRNLSYIRKLTLIVGVLLLSACTILESDTVEQTPTLFTRSTPEGDGMYWDLVFISDSSGWHAGSKYAEFIEADLGVSVRFYDFSIGALSARAVINYLREPEKLEYDLKLKTLGLKEKLTEAEVVVLYTNPRSAELGDWDCVSENPYVNDCSSETFNAYRSDLAAIYQEILTLRGDDPVIIRAFDAYNPLYSLFKEHGVYEACLGCWETYNQVIHQAADEFNIPVANVFEAFNGPNHDEDPREKGYIGSDGIHTTEEGSTVIATLLRELGYEPTQLK